MKNWKTIRRLSAPAILLVLLITLSATGCGGGDTAGEAPETPINSNLPAIKLIAPDISGAGEVPGFEWQAVEGAANYRLVVLDGNGELLWAWNGPGTKVNLGGLPGERPEGVSGPVISQGSSWSVIAFDESGKTLATSDIRSVSP